jgi:hypothetical protein
VLYFEAGGDRTGIHHFQKKKKNERIKEFLSDSQINTFARINLIKILCGE